MFKTSQKKWFMSFVQWGCAGSCWQFSWKAEMHFFAAKWLLHSTWKNHFDQIWKGFCREKYWIF